jgi:Ca2+-transporting ATPase
VANYGDGPKMTLWKFYTFIFIVVTIVLVSLPKGVTLSLTFVVKKKTNDLSLVHNLASCETMGSATCICSNKAGTLTTNHMTIVKLWMCKNIKEIHNIEEAKKVMTETCVSVSKMLTPVVRQGCKMSYSRHTNY